MGLQRDCSSNEQAPDDRTIVVGGIGLQGLQSYSDHLTDATAFCTFDTDMFSAECRLKTQQQSPPLNAPSVGLLSLASEIREIMFYQIAGREAINITIYHPKGNKERTGFRYSVPKRMSELYNISTVCKSIREEVVDFMARNVSFHSLYTDSLGNIPKTFGGSNTALIQTFDFRLEFEYKIVHERLWPPPINFLVTKMPQLRHLKLYSQYLTNGRVLPPNESSDYSSSITRHDQERRALLRLGAFLNLRHPKLSLLTYPAYAGPTFEKIVDSSWEPAEYFDPENTICAVELFDRHLPVRLCQQERWVDACRSAKHVVTDTILNATVIRRKVWTDLAHSNIAEFSLDQSARSSEVNEDNSCYINIDTEGYTMTYDPLPNLWCPKSVDRLIEEGDEAYALVKAWQDA